MVTKNDKLLGLRIVEPSTMYAVPLDELFAMQFSPLKWLVDNLIPEAGITVISAPPDSLKTWLTSYLAVCLASGKPAFGRFTTTQSGVLFVDEENGEAWLREQLKLLGASSELPIRIRSRNNFTVNDLNIGLLIMDSKNYGLNTIIFDSLIDMHESNENDAVEMGRVFKHFKRLVAEGISVIILHHNRKPGADGYGSRNDMRGSSNILAQVDAHIMLSRQGDRLKVIPTKLRRAKPRKPFSLLFKDSDGILSFDYLGAKADVDNKDTVVEKTVLDVLGERDLIPQQELIELVKDKCGWGNENDIRTQLWAMESKESVFTQKGSGRALLYSLAPNPEN